MLPTQSRTQHIAYVCIDKHSEKWRLDGDSFGMYYLIDSENCPIAAEIIKEKIEEIKHFPE